MTAPPDPDRLISSFLFEGPVQMHDQVYDAVRAEIEQRRQRAVVGPWRIPALNKLIPVGLGTAAVVVAVIVGAQFLGSPEGGVGTVPTATPEPTATPQPTATPAAPPPSALSAPPLTETFTSTQHGMTLSYPEGWSARAATEPWTESTYALLYDPPTPYIDYLSHPILGDHLFLNMASQPHGDATSEEWMAARMAGEEGCTATEPIEVDGATGLIGGEGCDVAVVTVGGRGYFIHLSASSDNPSAVASYDRAWFESVLATVQLNPEDAVD
jgi:hypothetical protein